MCDSVSMLLIYFQEVRLSRQDSTEMISETDQASEHLSIECIVDMEYHFILYRGLDALFEFGAHTDSDAFIDIDVGPDAVTVHGSSWLPFCETGHDFGWGSRDGQR